MTTLNIWKDTFTANSQTDGYQIHSDVVGLSNGNILVVWSDQNDSVANGTGYDVVGQLFDAKGQPIGDTLFLNDGYGNVRNEYNPDVTATPDGGFVLTYSYSSSESDQLFRRFDADGNYAGQQNYVVNDAAGGTYYSDFEVVYRPDGSSVVTYRRDNASDEDLMYRTINADGTVGSEVQVRYDQDPSGSNQGDPDNPTSAVLTDGRVIVAFVEEDSNVYGAEYAIINTNGTVLMRGNVAPATTRADDVDVAALPDGGWVITWREGTTLKGQIYNADQSKRGSVLDLATDTDGKYNARVVDLLDGGFALTWINSTTNTISTQTFDETGAAASPMQNVGFGGIDASDLEVGLSTDGRILISWRSYTNNNYNDSDIMSAILDPRDADITVDDGTMTTASMTGSKITGSSMKDHFYGMDGADDLNGKGGDDAIWGGMSADKIAGGAGHDQLTGGKGHDDITGGMGRDTVKGQNGRDDMWGGEGRDKMMGGEGADKIWGNKGADKIWGDEGADKIWAGNGNDKIIGGAGQDIMWGGAGMDSFVFTQIDDSANGARHRDTIRDFGPNRDVIDLSEIDANINRSGDQAFDFIGTAAFRDAGDLRVKRDDDDLIVQGDVNGDGRVDFEIRLEDTNMIDAFDFIL